MWHMAYFKCCQLSNARVVAWIEIEKKFDEFPVFVKWAPPRRGCDLELAYVPKEDKLHLPDRFYTQSIAGQF